MRFILQVQNSSLSCLEISADKLAKPLLFYCFVWCVFLFIFVLIVFIFDFVKSDVTDLLHLILYIIYLLEIAYLIEKSVHVHRWTAQNLNGLGA